MGFPSLSLALMGITVFFLSQAGFVHKFVCRGTVAKQPPRRYGRRALLLEPLEARHLLSADLWTQRGGNAGHTSYVDVSVNPALIEEAWYQPLGYSQWGTGSWEERAVAIDEARVYRTALEGYAPSGTYHVIAFDVQTGVEVWHRQFQGNAFAGVGEPSVAGGIVYVNRAGHSGISGGSDADLPRLYGLRAETGATVLQRTYQAQWGYNERPVIADNQLIVEDGYYGGISAYNASTLVRQWHVERSARYDPPALDDQFVYAYGSSVYARSDGRRLPNINHPDGYSSITQPMVSDTGRVLFHVSGYVDGATSRGISSFAYDGATHAHQWTTTTASIPGGKAVGNGVVAVTAGRDLIVLNEDDGSHRMTWQAPNNLTAEIVLTRTHAFVQSLYSLTGRLATVHAVDLATGVEVWSFGHTVSSGSAVMELAMGSGHLLLSHHLFVRAFALPAGNTAPVADDLHVSIHENSPVGTEVGTVVAHDPDGDPLTFSIIGGTGRSAFSIHRDTGVITVADSALLDFETTQQFVLTVSVSDGDLSDTARVTIDLLDILDTIDFVPGDDSNTINLNDSRIAVAILSTAWFDATTQVDVESLTFGATGEEDSLERHKRHGARFDWVDVDGDGLLDLVVYFTTSKTGLDADATDAVLEGLLEDGTAFRFMDAVTIQAHKGGGGGNGKGKKK